jgi:hypothetical protein
MKPLMEATTAKRLLQRGVDNGWWSVADLDRPSQGFKLATEHFSPEFGDTYTPPVWTNPLRAQTEDESYEF